MSKPEGWFSAIEHIKCSGDDSRAIDDSDCMNISSQFHNQPKKGANVDMNAKLMHDVALGGLMNVDEDLSYHSFEANSQDRYDPGIQRYAIGEADMPGIIDVSSIQSENPGVFNITLSQDEDMSNLMHNQDQTTILLNESLEEGSDIQSGSDTDHTESTEDGGSILLNMWNEDYEGRPDPEVVKQLTQVERLPRDLDPYIKNQIERAKIIGQLKQLDDDCSSDASCEFMCTQLFLPKTCEEDDDDDSNISADSIVDTVINFDSNGNTATVDEIASFDVAADTSPSEFKALLNHSKPKKITSYHIPSDREYRPGAKPKDLVLMLPKRTINNVPDFKVLTETRLPMQHANVKKNEVESPKESTYQEKEMEFTLQKYDSTPNRIAELVLQGKTPTKDVDVSSSSSSISASSVSLQSSFSSSSISDTSPKRFKIDVDLNQLASRQNRETDDDDPIEGDRSVLSPSEVQLRLKERDEFLLELKAVAESKKWKLSQLLNIFNNKQSCITAIPSNEEAAKKVEKTDNPIVNDNVKLVGSDQDELLITQSSTESVRLNPVDTERYAMIQSGTCKSPGRNGLLTIDEEYSEAKHHLDEKLRTTSTESTIQLNPTDDEVSPVQDGSKCSSSPTKSPTPQDKYSKFDDCDFDPELQECEEENKCRGSPSSSCTPTSTNCPFINRCDLDLEACEDNNECFSTGAIEVNSTREMSKGIEMAKHDLKDPEDDLLIDSEIILKSQTNEETDNYHGSMPTNSDDVELKSSEEMKKYLDSMPTNSRNFGLQESECLDSMPTNSDVESNGEENKCLDLLSTDSGYVELEASEEDNKFSITSTNKVNNNNFCQGKNKVKNLSPESSEDIHEMNCNGDLACRVGGVLNENLMTESQESLDVDHIGQSSVSNSSAKSRSSNCCEEVVIGVAIEGTNFVSPSDTYGVIIELPQAIGENRDPDSMKASSMPTTIDSLLKNDKSDLELQATEEDREECSSVSNNNSGVDLLSIEEDQGKCPSICNSETLGQEAYQEKRTLMENEALNSEENEKVGTNEDNECFKTSNIEVNEKSLSHDNDTRDVSTQEELQEKQVIEGSGTLDTFDRCVDSDLFDNNGIDLEPQSNEEYTMSTKQSYMSKLIHDESDPEPEAETNEKDDDYQSTGNIEVNEDGLSEGDDVFETSPLDISQDIEIVVENGVLKTLDGDFLIESEAELEPEASEADIKCPESLEPCSMPTDIGSGSVENKCDPEPAVVANEEGNECSSTNIDEVNDESFPQDEGLVETLPQEEPMSKDIVEYIADINGVVLESVCNDDMNNSETKLESEASEANGKCPQSFDACSMSSLLIDKKNDLDTKALSNEVSECSITGNTEVNENNFSHNEKMTEISTRDTCEDIEIVMDNGALRTVNGCLLIDSDSHLSPQAVGVDNICPDSKEVPSTSTDNGCVLINENAKLCLSSEEGDKNPIINTDVVSYDNLSQDQNNYESLTQEESKAIDNRATMEDTEDVVPNEISGTEVTKSNSLNVGVINKEEMLEIVDIDDSHLSASPTEFNATSHCEKGVVGIAIEGTNFVSPSAEYGVIIQPEHLESMKKMALSVIESDVDSRTSEQYKDMILNVTNIENFQLYDSVQAPDLDTSRNLMQAPDLDTSREVIIGRPTIDSQNSFGDAAPRMETEANEQKNHHDSICEDLTECEFMHIEEKSINITPENDCSVDDLLAYYEKTLASLEAKKEGRLKQMQSNQPLKSKKESPKQSSGISDIAEQVNTTNSTSNFCLDLNKLMALQTVKDAEVSPREHAREITIRDDLKRLQKSMSVNSTRLVGNHSTKRNESRSPLVLGTNPERR